MFWRKKRADLGIQDFKYRSAEQLHAVASQLQLDIENFWQFRAKTVLSLVSLHTRRRTRLLLFYSFNRYKAQSLRSSLQKERDD